MMHQIYKKELDDKLKEQELRNIEVFEALFNSTIEGLIIYDSNKRCIEANNVAPKLLGYDKEEMIGKCAFDFISNESLSKVKKAIENNDQEPYEAMILKKDGESFPAIIRGKNIVLNNKKLRVSAIIDISLMKQKEQEVYNLAYYDSLTSLPNRVLLREKVNFLVSKNMDNKLYGAFIFIDLDHFKTINDTKGHLIGDEILIKCAKRLQRIVRDIDTISRFGGDEFILLFDIQTKNKFEAIEKTKKLCDEISALIKKTFLIEKSQYQLSASIGIAIFNNRISFDELLRRADTAMYYSKYKGRDNYSFFNPSLQETLERKAIILERLRDAINFNKLDIFYQTQVNSNEEIIGVEALARWNDYILGYVSPAEFIPIAEESGLIIKFGAYLIKEVIKVIKEWEGDPIKKSWRVSVNVSLKQFERDDFEYFMENIILKYNINPALLRLEITESLLLENSNKALAKVDYLKKLGLTISIDDFGTGYSSLAYLKKLSLDELKIDKSFIEDILQNESDEAIVTAILGIGNKFGFEVIAEGVETKQIYEKLLALGCKYFQGYYFSKALSKEEL